MIPLPTTAQPEIDLSKCVLWAETSTIRYLVYFLKQEMHFEVKVHKIQGNLSIPAAAIWEANYGFFPLNVNKAVVLEFASQEGVIFMVNQRYGVPFERVEEMLLPVPFRQPRFGIRF